MNLFLPEAPSSNRYWRHARGRTYRSAEARTYIATVRALCLAAKVKPLKGDVCVDLAWYRSRKAGDLDNRGKVLLDALNGIAYLDDKQVGYLAMNRYDGYATPGMHVQVWERRVTP